MRHEFKMHIREAGSTIKAATSAHLDNALVHVYQENWDGHTDGSCTFYELFHSCFYNELGALAKESETGRISYLDAVVSDAGVADDPEQEEATDEELEAAIAALEPTAEEEAADAGVLAAIAGSLEIPEEPTPAPSKRKKTTPKSDAPERAKKDSEGHGVRYLDDKLAELEGLETWDQFAEVVSAESWQGIGLLNKATGKFTDEFSEKPDCLIYKRDGKKRKVLVKELARTFNVEYDNGEINEEATGTLAAVTNMKEWNTWKDTYQPSAIQLKSIRAGFTVQIDELEEQLPVVNYKSLDGSRGGTYVKDLTRYFDVVELVPLSEEATA